MSARLAALVIMLGAGVLLCTVHMGCAGETDYGVFVGKGESSQEITLVASTQFPSLEVDGFEFDHATKKIILLLGERRADRTWALTEFPDPEHASGTVVGRSTLQAFEGTWRSDDGRVSVPLLLRRVKQQESPVWQPEVRSESQSFNDRAFQATVSKDYRKALYFLKLYRVTSNYQPGTAYWEALLNSEISHTVSAFYQQASTCTGCDGMQAPLAYVLSERGDLETAKHIYRRHCRIHPHENRLAFTCLMYASLSERMGDRIGMLEGYDFACAESPLGCSRSFGPRELRLIDDVKSANFSLALQELKQPGLNVNAKGGQALYEAVVHHSTELVQELLNRGADPDLQPCLVVAIANGLPEIARLLLGSGADPNLRFPLDLAASQGDIPMAEELIRKGADVNYNDYVGVGTALMAAAEGSKREMVRLLLRHGADPTVQAKFHDPALVSAADPEIKKMLEQALRECETGARKCEEMSPMPIARC